MLDTKRFAQREESGILAAIVFSVDLLLAFLSQMANTADIVDTKASASGAFDSDLIPRRVKSETLLLHWYSQLSYLTLRTKGTEWRTCRQVYLCR